MIQTKLFDVPQRGEPEGNAEINEWLKQNPNISILSTNSFANESGWGYIILYKLYKETDVGYDSDEVD